MNLRAIVTNQHGFPIPNVPVEFESAGDVGGFGDDIENPPANHPAMGNPITVVTDSEGEAEVVYRQRTSQYPGGTTITATADGSSVTGKIYFTDDD